MEQEVLDRILTKRQKGEKLDRTEKEAVLGTPAGSSDHNMFMKLGIDKMLKTACNQCNATFLPYEIWQLYHCPKCGAEIKIV